MGIIGPNGSGKSTLIKAMLGFVKPDLGDVKIFGREASAAKGDGRLCSAARGGRLGFPNHGSRSGHHGALWAPSLVARHVSEDLQIADEALEKVRMSEFASRQIGQLSGGQQQRVFMARALAQNAEILLLDEPFSGVDAATENAILDVLQETKNQGKTLCVVHHDLATAAEYFDYLILLKQRMFGFGTPSQILVPQLLCDVYEGNMKVFAELSSTGKSGESNP